MIQYAKQWVLICYHLSLSYHMFACKYYRIIYYISLISILKTEEFTDRYFQLLNALLHNIMSIIIYNSHDGAPELIKWKKSSNPVLRTGG